MSYYLSFVNLYYMNFNQIIIIFKEIINRTNIINNHKEKNTLYKIKNKNFLTNLIVDINEIVAHIFNEKMKK